MAEVVGLVAAGGQFIEQSVKIIKLSKKVRDKYKDAPKEIEGWQRQIESLQNVIENVRQSPGLHSGDVSSTINQCKSVSDSLLDVFSKVKFSSSDAFGQRTWRVAISFTKEEEIGALFSQLEQLKSTLDIQIGIIHLNQSDRGLSYVASLQEGMKLSYQPGTEEERCLQALFVTDVVSDREGLITLKGTRTPGTFEWIPQTKQYRDWIASDHALLWISGPPGKGKTVISIFLSKLMEATRPDSTVTYFFCDNKTATRNGAANVLRGLMSQLIYRQPHLLSILIPIWRIQKDILFRTNSFETLWRIFTQMLEALKDQQVFCVLDALDEVDGESMSLILRKIKSLFDPHQSIQSEISIKLLIASREDPKILPQTLEEFPRITLGDLNNDIQLYISEKVAYLAKIKKIEESPLHHRIEEAFRQSAEGTFLWVSYMAQDLEHKSLSDIELALTELPRGLYEIYERIMSHIKMGNRHEIAEMLMWILFAERPLTISELCRAIQIQASDTLTREEVCFDYIQSCGHLLQLQSFGHEDGTWVAYSSLAVPTQAGMLHELRTTFLHQSAKDFLLRTDRPTSAIKVITDSSEAHGFILDCLLRLLEEEHCDGPPKKPLEQTPLLIYAMNSRTFHMRQLHDNIEKVLQKHKAFFGKTSRIRDKWGSQGFYHFMIYGGDPVDLPLLHMACNEGLYYLVRVCVRPRNILSRLRHRRHINQKWGPEGGTPLHLAAKRGSLDIVRLLLECGADVSIRDNHGHTPLHVALRYSNIHTYRLLLTAKQSSQVFKEEFNYFTHSAQHHRATHRNSLLHAAASSGYEDICCELIEKHNYSVSWKNYAGKTTIQLAISRGRIELANRLKVDWGASLNPEIDILRAIVDCKHAEHVKSGLQMYKTDWGCDINAIDEDGNTIFHYNKFNFSTMCAIQELGCAVDWDRRNKAQGTFLHGHILWLTDARLLSMFLLHSQFNINVRDRKGRTPLHYFLTDVWYREDYLHRNVDLLLDFGADPSLRDNRGQLAVDIAQNQLDKAQRLLGAATKHWGSHLPRSVEWYRRSIEILTDYTTVAMDVREVKLRLDDYAPGWNGLS